jgi:sugar lactone lactonase YvrE
MKLRTDGVLALLATHYVMLSVAAADETHLKVLAATFPAMPREAADVSAFTTNAVTFASGAPFNDLEFTILDTEYMDGENGGYDTFLPVDTAVPFPGSERVMLLRCALNTDLDPVYGAARGDRIILGTAEQGCFFLKGSDGVDNDYAVIQHMDYNHGHVQLAGQATDYGLVYAGTNDGCATDGWYLFHTNSTAPDLIAFIYPCHDLVPPVSGNPPVNTNVYCNPAHALSLTNATQFRYAKPINAQPAIPGGVFQMASPGKEIVDGLTVDAEGNMYLVGCSDGNLDHAEGAQNEIFVAKVAPSGQLAWVTELTMTEGTILKDAIADQNYLYVCGRTLGHLPGFVNAGRWDGILLKLRLDTGQIVAMDQWGNRGIDGYGNIELDGAGGLFLSGQGSPAGPPTNDDRYLVAKHRTSDLANVWRMIDPINDPVFAASAEAWGGLTYQPTGTGSDGRLIVAGWYFTTGGADAFIAIYDDLTNSVPTRTNELHVKSPGARADWILDNTVDANGNIYVAGYTTGAMQGDPLGEGDAFVIRYDPDLSNPVVHQFGTHRSDMVRKMGFTTNGMLYVLCCTYGDYAGTNRDPDRITGDLFIQTFDGDLNPLKNLQFGTPHEDRGFLSIKNGTLFIGGTTEGSMVETNSGSFDAFVLALDPGTLNLASGYPPDNPFVLALSGSLHDMTLSWPAVPGGGYDVYVTTNLVPAAWVPLQTNLTTPWGTRRIEMPVGTNVIKEQAPLFFRAERSD